MDPTSVPPRPSAAQLHDSMQAAGLVPEHHRLYLRDEPTGVRAIAEWEPMGGVLLAYPGTTSPAPTDLERPPGGTRAFGVPDELIVRMQQGGRVRIFVICNDPGALAPVNARLATVAEQLGLPFDPALVHLVPWDSDTYWTRDFGPWWIHASATGELGIAHHVYTSLGSGSVGMVEGNQNKAATTRGGGIFRPNDSAAAIKFSDFLDGPVRAWNAAGRRPRLDPHHWYFTGLLDVGGNFMTTGDGFLASSYLVARQNEVPGPDSIDARMDYITTQMHRFLGIDRYLVLTDPSGTYIGHIDCWAKFLALRTVLVARSPDPAVDRAYDEVAAEFESLGFTVHRVVCPMVAVPGDPAPTAAPYCNSLILNDEVYVPLAAAPGHEDDDAAALDVYRSAMPGHRVHGIHGKPDAPWRGTDALHCRTMGVPRRAVDAWARATAPAI